MKFETRNSKFETNSKLEIRRVNLSVNLRELLSGNSGFRIRISFEFRTSDFDLF
jgi:hypothetical protein